MSSIQQQEQTLNCETCKIDIIRDSEEHNNCIIDDTGEKIYCRNCVEEEIPKCLECDNDASKNKYYPDSEGGKYWTLCEKCYELDQEEIRNIDTVD